MKILIIDDEALIRKSLCRVFEQKGHQVELAEDGSRGLEKWREFDPDLVVIDVLMPGLTGPQVLQKLGSRRAKVMMITAYAGEHDMAKLRGLGVESIVTKPFQDVFEVVRLAESL